MPIHWDHGSRGSTAQHTQHRAQQGHGAEQQPSTSQGEFSNTRGTHSCSRACMPKQLQRGKQVALLSTTWRGEKNQESGQGTGKATRKFLLSPCSQHNSHQTFKPPLCHHHSLKPFSWGKDKCAHPAIPPGQLQKGTPGFGVAVFKTFVSKHLGTESCNSIAEPPPCASGSSRPCSDSSRPCSLPLRYQTLQRLCRTTDKCPAGQLLSRPLPSLCPGTKLRKQGQFPHFLLCWPLVGSVCRQYLMHPLDALLGLPVHPSCVSEERSQSTPAQQWNSGCSPVPQPYTCLNSQSNKSFQQQLSQNIYSTHCNLSWELCIIFPVCSPLFAYPKIQISASP